MNHCNSLASFDLAFSDLYSGSSDSIGQTYQFDACEQQLTYQGLSVRKPNTSFPVHQSQSARHQKNTASFKSLSEYDINSLILEDLTGYSGPDIPDIPQSVLDKYVPWNTGNKLINDELSSIPNFPFTQQAYLSVSGPDPIPAGHSNQDDRLTHHSAVLFNRQDLPPVTVVNPINLNQTTSDKQTTLVEEIADSLHVEFQSEQRQALEKRKLMNQRRMERYNEIMKDPEKRKLRNQRQRERYSETMKDPEKRKLKNQRQRERRQDPEKRNRDNQRRRERMQDPEKRKLIKQCQRKGYNEKVKDPEKRKLDTQRQRERRQDPEKRKLINQRQRERMQDPEKRKLFNQRQRERYHEKRKLFNQRQRERYHEKRKLENQRKREQYSEIMKSTEQSIIEE